MLELYWLDGTPLEFAGDLERLNDRLQDMTEPLAKSVTQVQQPAITNQFNSGGEPGWEPLSVLTEELKGHDEPLFETGNLRSKATSFSSWNLSENEASLVGIPEYGHYQNEGFYNVLFNKNVPARTFAFFSDPNIDGIVKVFEAWLQTQLQEAE